MPEAYKLMREKRSDSALLSLRTSESTLTYSRREVTRPQFGRCLVFDTQERAVNCMYLLTDGYLADSDLVVWRVNCGNLQKEIFLAVYEGDQDAFWHWRALFDYPPDNKGIAKCVLKHTLVTPRGTLSADWVELVKELERRSE